MIISLHIPKTAGKSFKSALLMEYGSNIEFDYGANPQKSSQNIYTVLKKNCKKIKLKLFPGGTKLIHGHFCLDSYKYFFPKAPRICFAREPLSLLISFYDYINLKSKKESKLRLYYEKVIDSKVEDFLLSQHAQSFYKRMFGSFDYRDFSFIGILEKYEESINLFNKLFGTSLIVKHVNKTNEMGNQLSLKSSFSSQFLNEFRTVHKFNYEFYNYALSFFEKKTEELDKI